MKLYEINENYRNIADLLSNPEFFENPDIIGALEAVEDEFNNKAVNTVKAIKIAEGDIETIDNEIKRLQTMKKVRQNALDRVKDYLKRNMADTGIFKIESPLFKISYAERQNAAVELDEALFLANNLNEDLVTIKITPSKTAIKKALEAGEQIIGARLVDSQILTIK
ncbi:TPA: siphovirus Gp157 family protein [Mannheimia haemolytica]|uniref:siphovirus Gp157 family protein n=1 Tax=Mannheimia haemolytica TaxID=75985 RepID=UPI001E56D012|nr:siphovirus Gp157 family protein [Mannheimia haemolytica]UFK42086.1 siphovirus Gp157 family protein [Mannheimia haemolytica]HDL1114125.1 siphovirus Gp157 family protein [Mannheimia haemolytica]HDL1116569.1 siphovirus Gp157 family protein [Mannheimia haemolytica]HDL1124834.1 siphovirus Gp157 family protein [Mannheimia haemolytica]HDL1127288.1 siphovirus Gp157 family protein [Mannheimia haemolytica]